MREKYIENIEYLKYWCQEMKSLGLPLVVIGGKFRAGVQPFHLSLFDVVSQIDDARILCLMNNDVSLRQLGIDPICSWRLRAESACALDYVDRVYMFGDTDPSLVLRSIQPDFFVKGMDWLFKKSEDMPEVKYCKNILFVKPISSMHTTNLFQPGVTYIDDIN